MHIMTDLTDHFSRMALAIFVAYRALKNGETPVACVFVHGPTGEILSFGCNDTNRSLNGTRHAEFVGIDKILEDRNLLNRPKEEVTSFFSEVILYVTIEPCVMCASAIEQLGIKKVYFGAANDRFGGNGTVIKVQKEKYQSYGGILRVEAVHLLRSFYVQENDSAPVPKIKKNKDIEGKEFPENLEFSKYLSAEEFTREYGDARFAQFYGAPNPHLEITPRVSEGYAFKDLLSKEIVTQIPQYADLYPDTQDTQDKCESSGGGTERMIESEIDNDIQELANTLPFVVSDGRVDYSDETVKRRRVET